MKTRKQILETASPEYLISGGDGGWNNAMNNGGIESRLDAVIELLLDIRDFMEISADIHTAPDKQ